MQAWPFYQGKYTIGERFFNRSEAEKEVYGPYYLPAVTLPVEDIPDYDYIRAQLPKSDYSRAISDYGFHLNLSDEYYTEAGNDCKIALIKTKYDNSRLRVLMQFKKDVDIVEGTIGVEVDLTGGKKELFTDKQNKLVLTYNIPFKNGERNRRWPDGKIYRFSQSHIKYGLK